MQKIMPSLFIPISQDTIIYIPRISTQIFLTHHPTLGSDPSILQSSQFKLAPDQASSTIPIRILSPYPLPKLNQINPNSQTGQTSPQNPRALLIHIHGGGFLSQTSFSHQIYTRVWADSLRVPVFSIDYRLAPNHPFPDGLDDVWQSYLWIIKYASEQLGVLTNKIILVGDSAGGALACGVIIKAIESGFRLPDGLMLVYPVVNMDMSYVSSSMFQCLNDPILGLREFLNMNACYIGDRVDTRNQFVSPLFCQDSVIGKFPKTKLMVTLNDPLKSDAFRFADKLLRNDVDLEVVQFEGFTHGAMNSAHEKSIPIYQRILKESLVLFEKLLD